MRKVLEMMEAKGKHCAIEPIYMSICFVERSEYFRGNRNYGHLVLVLRHAQGCCGRCCQSDECMRSIVQMPIHRLVLPQLYVENFLNQLPGGCM